MLVDRGTQVYVACLRPLRNGDALPIAPSRQRGHPCGIFKQVYYDDASAAAIWTSSLAAELVRCLTGFPGPVYGHILGVFSHG